MTHQTPYIGSKISLISKLDIRYEGILYTVDTNESTIALAKVRSFGTEDRPTPNPVSGRDDIYEYIIFKASDIKDLIVCETPKPVAQLSNGLPYDPAIITVSQGHSAPLAAPPGQNVVSAGSSRSDTPNYLVRICDGPPPISKAPGAGRIQNRNVPPVRAVPTQQSAVPNSVMPQPVCMKTAPQGSFNPTQQPPPHMRGGGGAQRGYAPRGGANAHYQRGASRGGAVAPGKTQQGQKMKFDSDYDFEKANEQFQETLGDLTKDLKKTKIQESEKSSEASDGGADVVEEGEIVENGAPELPPIPFYDRSSSFFDRISCEALEKQEGKLARMDWRKERETNQETFGHSAVRSLSYRRGRGFMGGRGRGMYHYNNGYNYGGGQQHGGFGYHQNGYNRRGGYRSNFNQ